MDDDLAALPKDFEDISVVEPSLQPRLAFRLLDLPPEIWLAIGAYAVLKSPLNVTLAVTNDLQAKMVAQPAITRTCRLLRKELLPVFYKRNSFSALHFSKVSCIRKWFAAIGQVNCEAMCTFTFMAQYHTEFWVEQFRRMGIYALVSPADDDTGIGFGDWPHKFLVTFRGVAALRAEQLEYDAVMGEAMQLFERWIAYHVARYTQPNAEASSMSGNGRHDGFSIGPAPNVFQYLISYLLSQSHRERPAFTMPFVKSRPSDAGSSSLSEAHSTAYDADFAEDALSASDLSKTAKRYGKPTPVAAMRGSSRSQTYKKDAVLGDCPSGQLFYNCQTTGFIGCCSINPCNPGSTCPESAASSAVAAAISSASAAKSSSQAAGTSSTAELVSSSAAQSSSSAMSAQTAVVSATSTPPSILQTATSNVAAAATFAPAPSCPGGNNNVYTDNSKLAYTVHCNSDNSAPSYDSIQVQTGGYAECFSSCSLKSTCMGFTYVGLDNGSCYFKSSLLTGSYVAKAGSNYITASKNDPTASVSQPALPDKKKSNTGAIAGGVVAGVLSLVLVLVLIAFLVRRRRAKLDSKRATMTHIFGGAVEPGKASSPDDQQMHTLPIHQRSGSTSHDVFAPYGGAYYQSSTTPQYSPVTWSAPQAKRRPVYRPLGFYRGTEAYDEDGTAVSSVKSGGEQKSYAGYPASGARMSEASEGGILLPASIYHPTANRSADPIPMLDSTPVRRATTSSSSTSSHRAPRFVEHISKLADTSPPVTPPRFVAQLAPLTPSADSPTLGRDRTRASVAGLADAERRDQHLMSWNNYSDRHVESAEHGELGATMSPGKDRPGERRQEEAGVSPDLTKTPIDRGFVVSPLGSLERKGGR
nr:hypothetical protein B0A51_13843 [Rachicladosporium sp. CCFEE 5018]